MEINNTFVEKVKDRITLISFCATCFARNLKKLAFETKKSWKIILNRCKFYRLIEVFLKNVNSTV
jgi:hypothetical protein